MSAAPAPVALSATLWGELEEPVLEWESLEEGFFDPNSRTNKAVTSSEEGEKQPPKPKVISLYDGKRTQNVSIAVGRMRKSTTEIAALCVQLDATLDIDTVEFMIKMVPTADEATVIKNYDGDVHELDTPGQLFHELVEIPRLLQRLQTFHLTLRWPGEMHDVYEQIGVLQASSQELLSADCQRGLFRILATVLATGNYMNGSTSRGQATGIKLDVLLKLENVKRSEGKGSLLHFIVQSMQKLYPEEKPFFDDWEMVWSAEKVRLPAASADDYSLFAQ